MLTSELSSPQALGPTFTKAGAEAWVCNPVFLHVVDAHVCMHQKTIRHTSYVNETYIHTKQKTTTLSSFRDTNTNATVRSCRNGSVTKHTNCSSRGSAFNSQHSSFRESNIVFWPFGALHGAETCMQAKHPDTQNDKVKFLNN